jgi:hypothetical protein
MALLRAAKAACPATAAGSAAAAAAAAAWSGWPRGRHRGLLKAVSRCRCAFKHHAWPFDPPRGTIFSYCLFVNIHLLEKCTLLQTFRSRLPLIKSNNCYNVR